MAFFFFLLKTKTYLDLPNKGQVHPQRSVSPRAVYTEEHTIGDAGPAGVFSHAVKANLKVREQRGHPK